MFRLQNKSIKMSRCNRELWFGGNKSFNTDEDELVGALIARRVAALKRSVWPQSVSPSSFSSDLKVAWYPWLQHAEHEAETPKTGAVRVQEDDRKSQNQKTTSAVFWPQPTRLLKSMKAQGTAANRLGCGRKKKCDPRQFRQTLIVEGYQQLYLYKYK